MPKVLADIEYLSEKTINPSFVMQDYGTPSIRHGEYQTHSMNVKDARLYDEPLTLDEHGFCLLNHKTQFSDFNSDSSIIENYYPEITSLIKSVTGASQVEIIDHTIRISEQQEGIRGIATHVHNDYTKQSAPQRLKEHLGDIAGTRFLKKNVSCSLTFGGH